MITFNNFSKTQKPIDKFSPEMTIISKPAFDRFLKETTTEEYCFIIPNYNDINCYEKIRDYFSKTGLGLYPISIKEGKNCRRVYLLTKKPSMQLQEYKNIIVSGYNSSKIFSVLYQENCKIKQLHEQKVITLHFTQINTDSIEMLIEKILNKKVQICGIEVPLNSDTKLLYKANDLLVFNLNTNEFRQAKNWSHFR